MKKILSFFLAIIFAVAVAVTPQTALAEHEDYTCEDWGNCPSGYYWGCYTDWNMWPPQQVCGWYPYY